MLIVEDDKKRFSRLNQLLCRPNFGKTPDKEKEMRPGVFFPW